MSTLLDFVDRLMKPVLKRIVKNRWNYTEEEYQLAGRVGLFEVLDLRAMSYWIKADPICSSHCSGCHNEGRPLYFNALGLLIRHKCPPFICIHGLSQLSPLIYSYYDHLLMGRDPNASVFRCVSCTDIGLEPGGLGNNTFRVTYEKMPVWEFIRFLLTMSVYLFVRNDRARGNCFAVRNAALSGGPPAADYRDLVPLAEAEMTPFLAAPDRVRRLRAIEKFKDWRIVIRVVRAAACIAGHKEDDEFVVDARGVLEPRPDGGGVCMMAIHKVWWRVLLMLERMIEAEGRDDDFTGKIFDLPLNCYGAGLPLGSCGEILMQVEVRKAN